MKKGLVLLFVLIFSTPWVYAERPRPALAKPYLFAPIILDKKIVTEAWVFPRRERRNFAVEAEPLIESLRPQLKEEALKNLQKRIRVEGVLSLSDLDSVGISARFDENSLELTLDIPLKHRRSNDLNLNYIEIGDQRYLRPSEHSGYLNLRAQQSYKYGNRTGDERLPFTGHVDFVENIRGFVLESMADYQEGSDYPWRRQDTRLRFDNEENMIRTTVGDLTLGTRGFQYAPNLGGVSVVREFSIQPYKTLRPLSNTEILIKRSSLLEVYVNGFLYSQLRLAPGIFNIRDFPLATGQNSVKVKIRDDLGQEEIYDFSVLFENTLLGKDVQEFSYGLGLPWTESGADRAYDNKAAFLTAFHRWGVSDEITVGLNFQNYLSKTMVGVELSGIAGWGYLSLDGAFAGESSRTQGFGQRLRYRSLDRMFGHDVPVVAALEFENRDQEFNPVSVLNIISSGYLRRYDGQLNFRFAQAWVFGVGAGTLEYPTTENQTTYRSNVIIPFNSQTRMELSYNKVVGALEEDRGLISIYWNESQGKYSASAYYDSLQKSSSASLNKNNLYRYDDSRWNASIQEKEGQVSGNLMAEYLAQPLSVRLEHFTSHEGSSDVHTTGIGLNTGFAWVGSRGAFTQPITDSFVLVQAENLPLEQELMINPTGDKGEAQLGPRSSTVLRDQSAYYKYFVNIDSTSLPLGYLLDTEFFAVQPTYRSGIAIDLNMKKKVMIKGRLLGPDKAPVVYVAGDIMNMSGQLIDNTFFTNKNGGFLIEGLEPGQYQIMTGKPGMKAVIFEVQANTKNILDLGDLIMKVEE